MTSKRFSLTKIKIGIGLIAVFSLMPIACAHIDPRRADVELKTTKPYTPITSYTEALGDLGLMTEIYGTPKLRIQSNPIGDNTGSSASTGGEIPRDITEIMKSSLNSIGGNVAYIPYDPSFMQNQVVTGYSSFANKTIPDVILTGGITEFDRGLETRGENTDASMAGEFQGLPQDMPGKGVEMRYGGAQKTGIARITLDFNLLDFQSMTGIPKMNTVNSMEVHKAMIDKELGISLFGQSFGGKGSVKKVQGRHAAIRLLVELSMIQVVGKHLMLPYWRLLGAGATADKYVLDQIDNVYSSLNKSEMVAVMQEWLYLYGYDLALTGQLDEATRTALHAVYAKFEPEQDTIDLNAFRYVYMNIPVTIQAKKRREALSRM